MAIYTVETTFDTIDAGDGILSLREALAQADASEGADTILFADAVQGRTIVLAGSQLTVSSDVTIDGGSGVTIDADGNSRVLLVQAATPDDPIEIVLARIAIMGGRTTGDDEGGGGIRVDGYAGLTLDHVTVSGNGTEGKYAIGGGIAASGDYTSLTLISSTVSNNHTIGDYAEGGEIYAYDVSLTNSTVSGNSTTGAQAEGGGIYAYDVSLTDTAVSSNRTAGDNANGGGIAGYYVSLTNSTVSGNSTAGAQAEGGGISGYSDATIELTNSTVSGNATAGAQAAGGGVFLGNSDYGRIYNSIVAGNVAAGSTDPDVAGSIGASNGRNIFGSDVVGNAPGDRENVPTGLLFAGGLADNGGQTLTIALRDAADNPALGAADPATAPASDQRGVARPQPAGTNPDIGAFELDQSSGSVVDGTSADDTLRGTAGAELLRGRAGSDRLWGFAGDDELFGGFGADVLVGGPGLDRITGGAGADRFVLRQPEAAPPGGPAYDEILDFTRSQQDRVDLQPIDARSGAAGNQALRFIGDDTFTRAGQLRYEATADGDFLVSGNIDRDLAADFAFIVRSGVAVLKGSDFLL